MLQSHLIPPPAYMASRGLPSRFGSTQWHVWLWIWGGQLSQVILVWWLGIRLMRLHTCGLQSGLLPVHMFILGSLIRCHHLTTFHLNQDMRIIHFWTKQLQTLEQGIDSILTASIKTPELGKHPLIGLRSLLLPISSRFLCLVSTITDSSKPQLPPSIRSHKLWSQARAQFSPVSLATKISASKLIQYFF